MIFIDSRVVDHEVIASALHEGVAVVTLDPRTDPHKQIADALADARDLAAIGIISHGADAMLQLGGERVGLAELRAQPRLVAAISGSLAPDGRLELYGCGIAASGHGFIEALKDLIGHEVAASSGPVGAAELGGKWWLDAATDGRVVVLPADPAALAAFAGVLTDTSTPIVATSDTSVTHSQNDGE